MTISVDVENDGSLTVVRDTLWDDVRVTVNTKGEISIEGPNRLTLDQSKRLCALLEHTLEEVIGD